jgi:hypothetical protein
VRVLSRFEMASIETVLLDLTVNNLLQSSAIIVRALEIF